MKNSNRICIIGVYFGKLPNYFNLWLKSAEANQTIDFKIFSDQSYAGLPDNVEFIHNDIKGLKNLVIEKLGMNVSLDRPYKCCDFKPAYGEIFSDYLTEYDYWGYCDFDLIFGDLKKFFDEKQLYSYERFLSMGHLGLYKNSAENNQRYKTLGKSDINYMKAFKDCHNYAFDEQGSRQIYENLGLEFFKERIFADISIIYKRFKLVKNDINYDYQIFHWENGKVFRTYVNNGQLDSEEFIYIHFKERGIMHVIDLSESPQRIFITPSGFYLSDENVTYDIIQKYNPFLGELREKKELVMYKNKLRRERIKKRIIRLFRMKEEIR